MHHLMIYDHVKGPDRDGPGDFVGPYDKDFATRGRRQEEQVDLMRRPWAEDSMSYDGEFHRFENASIVPRPSKPIPVLFGGSAPAVIDRCARLGDGWIPLGRPNQKSVDRIAEIERIRGSRGLTMEGFDIYVQAQHAGGDHDRWRAHATARRDLGATHLAIATHNAGETDIDGHLGRIAEYREAVEMLVDH